MTRSCVDSDDLSTNWADYASRLEDLDGLRVGNIASVRIAIFGEHANSYLGSLRTCQTCFEKNASFEDMPLDDRRRVAGLGERQTKWMGSIGASGFARQAVAERANEISDALDDIPLDREKRVERRELRTYLERVTEVRGIAEASASRFLTAKRPDLFVSVNGANEKSLERAFGFNPRSVEGYLDLHTRIWSYPWFDSSKPKYEQERKLWQARVALLDAFFYDPDER